MTFEYLKNTLKKHGFKLDFIQTGAMLDVLTYTHDKIDCDVIVEFDPDVEIPDHIQGPVNYGITEEVEFDYEVSKWLLPLEIHYVGFRIDLGIYFGEGMDHDGIYLQKEDMYLFDKAIELIINPTSFIDFSTEYTQKMQQFNENVKRFIPILAKHGLVAHHFASLVDSAAPYRPTAIVFPINRTEGVQFEFQPLKWNNAAIIYIAGESAVFEMNADLEKFEKFLVERLNLYEKMKKQIVHLN